MTTLKRILAATDFSADADHAVARAALLAAQLRMESATLLHVISAPWMRELRSWLHTDANVDGKLHAASRQALSEACDRLQRDYGVSFIPQLRSGRVVDEVESASAHVDLTVLGAWGSHPLRALIVGSTSERVLRTTMRPILVVKRPPVAAYQRVLIPVDFSPHSAVTIAYARAIAPGAELILLHVFEVPEEATLHAAGIADHQIKDFIAQARGLATQGMVALIRECGFDDDRTKRIVDEGYPPAVIARQLQELQPDLVVIGKHGKSLGEELLLGSVTLCTLAAAECDVLVVRAADDASD